METPERPSDADATSMLARLVEGDRTVSDRLLGLVYDELRDRARSYLRRGAPGATIQPTALVHEAYLRMIAQARPDWSGRTHFFAVAAIAMRQILVDQARARGRAKRGGGGRRVTLDDAVAAGAPLDVDVLALHEALERLAARNERHARIVELRYFAGLTVEEIAEVLGVSRSTVEAGWSVAKAWLRRELSRVDEP